MPRKRVYDKIVSRVRIPISPQDRLTMNAAPFKTGQRFLLCMPLS